jgi:serine O-acetyltransferase
VFEQMVTAKIETRPKRVSASEPDWQRETPTRLWDPGRRLLRAIRGCQRWHGNRMPWAAMMRAWHRLWYCFWSVVSGAEIPTSCVLGGGLLIPHPNGIVIHGHVTLGPNCLIFQQVTIGGGGRIPGVPTLEGHVDVGAGAKVLGGIRIGEHAKIGANAVVLQDIPDRATAVGIPARIIMRSVLPTMLANNASISPFDDLKSA